MKKAYLFVLMLFTANNIFAATQSTIFSESIEWKTSSAHNDLLSHVPSWSDNTLHLIWNHFTKSIYEKSSPSIQHNKDHVNYVNFNWGPLNNPYAKYQRPARLFVFIGDHPVRGENDDNTNDNYFMAPIIHNTNDDQYYVLEKGLNSPVLLDKWMQLVTLKAPKSEKIRINICEDYATGPEDSCGKMPYESEAHYVYNDYIPEENFAPKKPLSARRKPKEDWHQTAKTFQHIRRGSYPIQDTSVLWNDINERNKLLNTVKSWSDFTTIKSIYSQIRDLRYFTDENDQNFKRRITWLYPDDGCWSRAAAFMKDFFGSFDNPVATYSRPSKIFAFGNLCARSKNSVDGASLWWFHVAPIIRDQQTNNIYVLDPSVEASQPLALHEWVAKIADNTGACADEPHEVTQINICNNYGIVPWDNCQASASQESYAMLDQMIYMRDEKNAQKQVGNDPNKTLGDLPPWLVK